MSRLTLSLTKRFFSDVPAISTSLPPNVIKSSDYMRPKSRLVPFLFGALISTGAVYCITVNEVTESYKKLENSLQRLHGETINNDTNIKKRLEELEKKAGL